MKNKVLKLLFLAAAISMVFSGCAEEKSYTSSEVSSEAASRQSDDSEVYPEEMSRDESMDSYKTAVDIIIDNIGNLEVDFGTEVDKEFLDSMGNAAGNDVIEKLADALLVGRLEEKDLYSAVGYTKNALTAIINGEADRVTMLADTSSGATEMVFVGDVGFVDGYSVMNKYNSRGKGAEGIVSTEVLEIMRTADITMANNEFTLTTRGSPIVGKTYTFRGKPENVNIYHEMGVDIVGLANNHTFDYGPDSLTDTLATLDEAGIARVGAGENLAEAKAPYYYVINGRKIAVLASSAVDKYNTREATDKVSGVFKMFDIDPMCELIRETKKTADIVIAYVHWGHESTTVLTGNQTTAGRAFIDAGADTVIGMHSHCMQGVEVYNGKLIAYSLGNFTFSGYSLTCDMIKLSITAEGEIHPTIYPMMQSNNMTYIPDDEEYDSQMALLRKISINASIDDDGNITAG